MSNRPIIATGIGTTATVSGARFEFNVTAGGDEVQVVIIIETGILGGHEQRIMTTATRTELKALAAAMHEVEVLAQLQDEISHPRSPLG